MKRFYSNNIQNNSIYLENEEALHCTKVLRCKIGDTVEVLNGSGSLLEGKISIIQKHEVQIEISKILKEENAPEDETIKSNPEGFTHVFTFYYK